MRYRFLPALALTVSALDAQAPTPPAAQTPTWDVTQARGKTRDIDFTTNEGTWTSVDISGDGTFIVFDLLGHVYRMPATGGEATSLTQNSGVALNYHPRISPDGKLIAFISDRRGQNNLWVMNADGTNPRAVFTDPSARAAEPAWSADGQFIIVRRSAVGGGGGGAGGAGLFMYSKDGGTGISLVTEGRPESPSLSRDGRYLYYQVAISDGIVSGKNDVTQGSRQLRRLELATGRVLMITDGLSEQQYQGSSGGASDLAGRSLARVRPAYT
jgi:Tol biopolymer transport system component